MVLLSNRSKLNFYNIGSRSCGKRFYTKHGYILTLHFIHMKAALNEGASIEVRDGPDANSRLITIVDVKNYTRSA
jgi:hypothetical protein